MRWATRRLTVAEMCRWVERGLRVENEFPPATCSPRRVNAVRDDSPGARPESRSQPKGKSEDHGRKGSKGPRKGTSRAITPGREAWDPRNQPAASRQSQDQQGKGRTSRPNDRPPSPNANQGGNGGPSREGQPTICFPCDKAGRDSVHPYQDCKFWQEARKKMEWWRPQGKKGEVPSDQKGKAQSKPDEASSSRPRAAPA